jgi:hypothetical protein
MVKLTKPTKKEIKKKTKEIKNGEPKKSKGRDGGQSNSEQDKQTLKEKKKETTITTTKNFWFRHSRISVLVVLCYSFSIQSCLSSSARQVWSRHLMVLEPSCGRRRPACRRARGWHPGGVWLQPGGPSGQ